VAEQLAFHQFGVVSDGQLMVTQDFFARLLQP
jgi:hypothetical protein